MSLDRLFPVLEEVLISLDALFVYLDEVFVFLHALIVSLCLLYLRISLSHSNIASTRAHLYSIFSGCN
jgi:hypothetical protein